MQLLTVSNAAQIFDGEVIFQNISFHLNSGDTLAIIGANGAGKTTLMKAIMTPSLLESGAIQQAKNTTIGTLTQHFTGDLSQSIYAYALKAVESLLLLEKEILNAQTSLGEESVYSNVELFQKITKRIDTLNHDFENLGGFQKLSEVRKVLSVFGFSDMLDAPVSTLSGGQRTKLMLAHLLISAPDILLLDEPTNHLDVDTISWLENWLKSYNGCIVCVSHDRFFLDQVANKTLEISNGSGLYHKGNYSDFMLNKDILLAQQMIAFQTQQNEIKKLEDYIQKNKTRASTAKMAQSRVKRLNKIKTDLIDSPLLEKKMRTLTFPIQRQSGKDVFAINDLSIGHDNVVLQSHIESMIYKSEAIAIVGPNGIGKTSFIQSLIGKLPLLHGSVKKGANVDIGYYDQNHDDLHGNQTIYNYVHDIFPQMNDESIRSLLGYFLFTQDDVSKSLSTLSGGEKARVALAVLKQKEMNTLILDEPTNHLDIHMRETLEEALIQFEGTLIFVSHDRYFIDRIATKIWEFSESGLMVFEGNYSDYLEQKAIIDRTQPKTQEHSKPLSEKKKESQLSNNKRQQLTKQAEELESIITNLQTEIQTLQLEMANAYTQPDYLKQLVNTIQEKEREIEEIELTWLEIHEQLEM
ncbi:MAG: ATP-binding cassette domain-containing protein [Culicoidibacterales bacterium]